MKEIFPDINKLSVIKNAYTKFITSNVKKEELLCSYAIFLEAISEKDFHSQQELSEFVGCNKAHTSRTLLKMKQKELINMPNSNERIAILTEKGKDFIRKYRKTRKDFINQLIKDVSPIDIEVFTKVIDKIFTNAKKIGD